MDKHERPYKCAVQRCSDRRGFTSKGDLDRHIASFHSKTRFFCHEPGCSRGPDSVHPFTRKDNLVDHIKRRHGRTYTPSSRGSRSSIACNSAVSTTSSTPLQQVDEEPAAPSREKRRQILDMSLTCENVQGRDGREVDPHNPLKGTNRLETKLIKLEQAVDTLAAELMKERREHEKCRERLMKIIQQAAQEITEK